MQITEKLRAFRNALLGATLVAGLVAGLTATTTTATAAPPKGLPLSIKPEVAPKQLLIRLKPGADQADIESIAKQLGATVTKSIKGMNVYVLKTQTDMTVKAAENKLLSYTLDGAPSNKLTSKIKYIQPNFVYHTMDNVPNDPYLYLQWSMYNYGYFGGKVGADVKAFPAWDKTTGSSSVYVADIDTGIDYTHPDLVNNCWVNPDEIPGNGMDDDGNGYVDDVYGINACDDPYGDFPYYLPGDPYDDHFHGTHTAGTIGASGNNGTGVVGVNWNVKIIALKFLNGFGYGYTSDAVECLDYMHYLKTVKGINIVASNNSWSGGSYDQALYDAIKQSGVDGSLFCAAAANSGIDNDIYYPYPASYDLDNIIAVAATNEADQLASFSDYGLTTVDLGAPGQDIISTIPTWYAYYGYDIYYFLSGTSMATPHVTGAAALLHSYDASLTPVQIKQRILETGDSLGTLRGRTVSGRRLNLDNMLTGYIPPVPVSDGKVYVDVYAYGYWTVGGYYGIYTFVHDSLGDPISGATVKVTVKNPKKVNFTYLKGSDPSGGVYFEKNITKYDGVGTFSVTATATKGGKTGTGKTSFVSY